MNPKEVNPEILRQGRIIGPQPIQVMVSNLCVNCFPKTEPAIFMWGGSSLCQKCFVPLRKQVDLLKGTSTYVPGIDRRDYKETWGEDPVQDAEII